MSERPSTAGSSKDELNGQPDALDAAREAALIEDVIRVQERHREGGIEPELEHVDTDPEPSG